MNWPTSQDYNEAIQNSATAMSDPDLKKGEAVVNAMGLPVPRSGNFADVYQFKGGDGRMWAVKCFTRHVEGLQERYTKIDAYLAKANLPFTVGFEFLAEGVRIRGKWYPILKMEWVEGFTFNEFVRQNADKPNYLHALMQMWGKLAAKLRDANLAHADLQHGNVLLVPGNSPSKLGLKLIDYDGMWVPPLADHHSGEVGHPNFQHPLRLKERLFNADVDRFPHLVIACALRATLVGGKSFWDKYDNGDNLLFREQDLRNPAEAKIFKSLWDLDDNVVRTFVAHIALSSRQPLRKTPWLDDVLFDEGGPHLTPEQEKQAIELLGVTPPAPKSTAKSKVSQEFSDFSNLFDENDDPASSSSVSRNKPKKRAAVEDDDDDEDRDRRRSTPGKKGKKVEPKKSKMPLLIGGGVLALAAIGGIIAVVAGGKSDSPKPTIVQNNIKDDEKGPKDKQDHKDSGKIDHKDSGSKDPKETKFPKKEVKDPPSKDPPIIEPKVVPNGDRFTPVLETERVDASGSTTFGMSPDGKYMFASSSQRGIELYDISTGKLIDSIPAKVPLSAHITADNVLCFSEIDGNLGAWSIDQRKLIHKTEQPLKHQNNPNFLQVYRIVQGNEHDRVLLVAGREIVWWDLQKWAEIARIPISFAQQVYTADFFGDGDGRFVYRDREGVKVGELRTNKTVPLEGIGSPDTLRCGLSPNGRYVVGILENKPNEQGPSPLYIWDCRNGKQLHQLPDIGPRPKLEGFTGGGEHCLIHQVGSGNTVRVLNLAQAKFIDEKDFGRPILKVCTAPAANLIAFTSHDHKLRAWKMGFDQKPSGAEVVKNPDPVLPSATQSLNLLIESDIPDVLPGRLGIRADGKYFYMTKGTLLKVGSVATGKSIFNIRYPVDIVDISFGNESDVFVALGGGDASFSHWDFEKRKLLDKTDSKLSKLPQIYKTHPTSKADQLLLETNTSDLVLWDVAKWKEIESITPYPNAVCTNSVMFPDGKRILLKVPQGPKEFDTFSTAMDRKTFKGNYRFTATRSPPGMTVRDNSTGKEEKIPIKFPPGSDKYVLKGAFKNTLASVQNLPNKLGPALSDEVSLFDGALVGQPFANGIMFWERAADTTLYYSFRVWSTESTGKQWAVWDVANKKEAFALEESPDGKPEKCWVSPNGKWIVGAAVDKGGQILIWDAATGKWLRTNNVGQSFKSLDASPFSSDGRYVVFDDATGKRYVVDLEDGSTKLKFTPQQLSHELAGGSAANVFITGDEDGKTRLWRLDANGTGTPVIVAKTPDPKLPDPKITDPKITEPKITPKIVDEPKEGLVKTETLRGITNVAFSLDGKKLFATTDDGILHVLNPSTLEETDSRKILGGKVKFVGVTAKFTSPTGAAVPSRIILFDDDKKLRLFDLEKLTQIKEYNTDKIQPNVGAGQFEPSLGPDGTTVMICITGGFKPIFWDTRGWVEGVSISPLIQRMTTIRDMNAVTFSHDARVGAVCQRQNLTVWNNRTGQTLQTFNTTDHSHRVELIPEASIVIANRFNGGLRAWNYVNAKELWNIRPDKNGNWYKLASIPKKSAFITAGADNNFVIWDAVTGAELLNWKDSWGTNTLSISPDAKFAITSHNDGKLKLWALPSKLPTVKK